MRLVLDIEANALESPTKIWCIVCKNLDTNSLSIFRNVTDDIAEKRRFLSEVSKAKQVIGHNILGYDYPVLHSLLGWTVQGVYPFFVDTLILSKLVDYSRKGGHSLEQYGVELGYPKIVFNDFAKYSPEMEEYCVRDVEITARVYDQFLPVISDSNWQPSLDTEHRFQLIANSLHDTGFAFDTVKAQALLNKVAKELDEVDKQVLVAFPPREVLIREFTPRATKHGTISKSSIPASLRDRIHEYELGKTYRHTKLEEFNPSSHKQLIDVLTKANWKPTDRTKVHIETERLFNKLSREKQRDNNIDLSPVRAKLEILAKHGWKINENNLATLPEDSPPPARLLAKRILLESRRRTLTEWLALVRPDSRIHGKFYAIGAWTHRMAHQNPNTANIPTEVKLYGKEMRQLWRAPKNRLLVGVDAEGIQLRIFAHYINDPEFTDALVRGRKEDKSDPHSLNQRIMGSVCQSRQIAKRFIYALLLGAGLGKLAEILGCSKEEAQRVLDRILERYTGFAKLKKETIPNDAARGYFIGLDGRKVVLPGIDEGYRAHLCMSGYLQNGEAIVMKKACLLWHQMLHADNCILVNFVHDEWQTEVPNDMKIALHVARTKAESLRIVGEELGLKCPLAGSYFNDDHKDYTIGTNWYATH